MQFHSLQLRLGLRLLGQCLFVAVVQLLPESLDGLRALQLQCWGQKLVFDGPRINKQPHSPNALVAVELVLSSHLFQLLKYRLFDLLVLADLLQLRDITFWNLLTEHLGCELREDVGRDTKDGHEEGLMRVAMDVARSEVAAVCKVYVLDPLGGNVFSLCELENVLPADDELEATEFVDGADVTSVEPTIGVNRLGSLLLVAEVLLELRCRADQQLTTRVRLVGGHVLHVRHVEQSALCVRSNTTAVASGEVALVLDECNGVSLGKTVSLCEVGSEDDAEELMQTGINGRRATNKYLCAIQSKTSRNLLSPDAVVEHVLVGRVLLVV